MVPEENHFQRKILAVVTTGGIAGTGEFLHRIQRLKLTTFDDVAPVLEICRVLHSRGHIVEFATLAGHETLASPYSFVSSTHTIGGAITPKEAKQCSTFWTGHDRFIFRDRQELTEGVAIQKRIWAEASKNLKRQVNESIPDFVLVDWQIEPVVDFLGELHIAYAVMWPHIPWTRGELASLEHGSVMSRLRNILRCIEGAMGLARRVPVFRDSANLRRWREEISGDVRTPQSTTPNYISFVNSLLTAASSQRLPPSIVFIGPVLGLTFPPLSHELSSFLATHTRVLYIALGTYATFSAFDIQQIMQAILSALEAHHIDGVIWATQSLGRREFFDVFEDLLDNRNPHWRFLTFTPQRPILAHPSTRLFVTQCGTSSLNEAVYHGVPMVGIDKDHPLNCKQAEQAGIAQIMSYRKIDANELCEKIGLTVQDVYGSFERAALYVQQLAVAKAGRKDVAADVVEKAILDRERGIVTSPNHREGMV